MEPWHRPFTVLGLFFIILGLILVALPLIIRHLPNLERLPWIVIWVYRRNGFYFATSPLLIIISIVSLLLQLFRRTG